MWIEKKYIFFFTFQAFLCEKKVGQKCPNLKSISIHLSLSHGNFMILPVCKHKWRWIQPFIEFLIQKLTSWTQSKIHKRYILQQAMTLKGSLPAFLPGTISQDQDRRLQQARLVYCISSSQTHGDICLHKGWKAHPIHKYLPSLMGALGFVNGCDHQKKKKKFSHGLLM